MVGHIFVVENSAVTMGFTYADDTGDSGIRFLEAVGGYLEINGTPELLFPGTCFDHEIPAGTADGTAT